MASQGGAGTVPSFGAHSGSFLLPSPPIITRSVFGGVLPHQGTANCPKPPEAVSGLFISFARPETVPDGQRGLGSACVNEGHAGAAPTWSLFRFASRCPAGSDVTKVSSQHLLFSLLHGLSRVSRRWAGGGGGGRKEKREENFSTCSEQTVH